jgi:23S rRNA pseudouridine1911/1915/1917 synthase
MATEIRIIEVPANLKGKRLDQALVELCPDHSRSRLQTWIKAGFIKIGENKPSQRHILQGGETLHINVQPEPASNTHKKEPIPLEFVHVDEDIIVLNKPAGLVVHPGAGNPEHTLLNALLYHYPELEQLPRAGIVQRLDKDTSGLMIVAKSLKAHTSLVKQLQQRSMSREYQAVVNGVMTAGGTVNAAIGRHRINRKRMAVVERGKPAISYYTVLQRFVAHSHIRLKLESGRTHQIRVHMAHIHHSIVGDPVYGGRPKFPRGAGPDLITLLEKFPRQALHACYLRIMHPLTEAQMHWESDLPEDMNHLITLLKTNGN